MANKPRVIGTGLTGLVGSRIVELLKDKYDFIDFSLDSGIDILNPKTLEGGFVKDVKTVIHLAAFTDTNAAWDQRGDKSGLCFRLNVEGTRNILNFSQKHNLPLIHFSTDFVFDGQKNGVYDEADKPNPIEWYGQTKYEAENEVKEYATILRIAFPYRANFEPKVDLVRKIISKFKNGEKLKLFNDQITTPTFIDDIASAVNFFVDKPLAETYHCVGSSSQSPYDLAITIAKLFHFDENLVEPSSLLDYLKTENARPYAPNLSLSNQKIGTLGIKMSSLSDGLSSLLRQQQS